MEYAPLFNRVFVLSPRVSDSSNGDRNAYYVTFQLQVYIPLWCYEGSMGILIYRRAVSEGVWR